jgi:hypothetical protein
MRFQDKVAIVTGSSRGIGKAIAIALAREGADLVLAARSVEEPVDRFRLPGILRATADEIRALGRRALVVKTDVSLRADVEEMARKAIEESGRIDMLVNNAAVTNVALTAFLDMTPEECDLQIDSNFKGTLNWCRAVVPHMVSQHYGRIINITTECCQNAVAHFVNLCKLQGGRGAFLQESCRGTGTAWDNGQLYGARLDLEWRSCANVYTGCTGYVGSHSTHRPVRPATGNSSGGALSGF